MKLLIFPAILTLFSRGFWVSPKNRPAARPEPPGGITNFAFVLDFCMNRLAT